MATTTILNQIAVVLAEAVVLYMLSRLLFVWVLQSFASRNPEARGGRLVQGLRLPGNLIHELSHALGYLVCGYTVQRMVPCIFDVQGRGSCQAGRRWSPLALPWLAAGVAAVAPLVLGTLVLRGVAQALGIDLHTAIATHASVGSLLVDNIRTNLTTLDYHRWQTYLFLYLAFSIGSELSPSQVDLRRSLPTLLVGAAGLAIVVIALKRLPPEAPVYTFLIVRLESGLSSLQMLLNFGVLTAGLVTAITLLPAAMIRAVRG